MKVEINYVLALKAELHKINRVPFDKIIWLKRGVEQKYTSKTLDRWKYIGLNNTDFPGFNRKDT